MAHLALHQDEQDDRDAANRELARLFIAHRNAISTESRAEEFAAQHALAQTYWYTLRRLFVQIEKADVHDVVRYAMDLRLISGEYVDVPNLDARYALTIGELMGTCLAVVKLSQDMRHAVGHRVLLQAVRRAVDAMDEYLQERDE